MSAILPARKFIWLSLNNYRELFIKFVSDPDYNIMNNFREHISINPNIRFGKPCIKNTRITVSDILGWLSSGMTYEDIIKDFPEIKKEQILAALSFAAHREQAVKTIFHDKTAI